MALSQVYGATPTLVVDTRTLVDAAVTTAGGYMLRLDGTNLADPNEYVEVEVEDKTLSGDSSRGKVDHYVGARGGGVQKPPSPIYDCVHELAFYVTLRAAADRAVGLSIRKVA
ncbi:MAG: hypothetical protein AB7G23_19155 [Vicinamibacterales bacterium]